MVLVKPEFSSAVVLVKPEFSSAVELTKPEVLPAHGHSPYEIGHEKIFLCAGTTKIFSCPISHCSLLSEHYPINLVHVKAGP